MSFRAQGQSRQLSSEQNLGISDEDNIDAVRLEALAGPRHGQLVIESEKEYFTVEDLDSGAVVYEHDGSNTYR